MALHLMERMAVDKGLSFVRLAVFDTNPAQRLYARLGYQVLRSAAPLLHMEKRLRASTRTEARQAPN